MTKKVKGQGETDGECFRTSLNHVGNKEELQLSPNHFRDLKSRPKRGLYHAPLPNNVYKRSADYIAELQSHGANQPTGVISPTSRIDWQTNHYNTYQCQK